MMKMALPIVCFMLVTASMDYGSMDMGPMDHGSMDMHTNNDHQEDDMHSMYHDPMDMGSMYDDHHHHDDMGSMYHDPMHYGGSMDTGMYMSYEAQVGMPALCSCAGETEIHGPADVPPACIMELNNVCHEHFTPMVCDTCQSTFNSMSVTMDCFMAVVLEIHTVCYDDDHHEDDMHSMSHDPMDMGSMHDDHQHHDDMGSMYHDPMDMGSMYDDHHHDHHESYDMGPMDHGSMDMHTNNHHESYDMDSGSFEDYGSMDEGCMWVNHIYDHPGQMTCDCVHHADPCLADGHCVAEPMCEPQPQMVASAVENLKRTSSLVGLLAVCAILFLAWRCLTDRGDKYEYNLHLLAEAETEALVDEI